MRLLKSAANFIASCDQIPLITSCTCNIMSLISYMIIIIGYSVIHFENSKISDV